ncbi:conserved hypothetical protein [Beggiatoa sp. PS]|nr:conserved hypothetical protein [Beggiatoa sp. PS]
MEIFRSSKDGKRAFNWYFEKTINPDWKLRKIVHSAINPPVGKKPGYDEHELFNVETGEILNYPNWEWAEMDDKRLVWAEKGQIFSGKVTHAKVKNQRKLYDFNNMVFKPIKAPY